MKIKTENIKTYFTCKSSIHALLMDAPTVTNCAHIHAYDFE